MPREFIPGGGDSDIPRNAFTYFVREAVRRMWVSKRTSFVAVAMIAISLTILGAFLLVSENLTNAVTRWQEGRSRVTIFLESDATPQQIHEVDQRLAAIPDVSHRRFVTREQALARFKSYFSNLRDVVTQLDDNPFPSSFECDVPPARVHAPQFQREMEELRALPGIDEVQFDWEWVDRLKRLVNLINLVGIVAGGVLGLAAAFTIANVIRLTMMLYREEIEIMRLVGATERIIRGPFLVEGLVQGTAGSVIAVGLLYGFFALAQRIVASKSLFLGFLFESFLSWSKVAWLLAGGMFAGWFGSWLSVRERWEES
jgi:cell division transport system permease protein